MKEKCSFGEQIKRWRMARGTSQLALAAEAGVSSRHLSFLETGRSRPSRKMVERLAEPLDLPLRARNDLLFSAGFAPRYGERPLNDEELEQAHHALGFLLRMQEPYPAFVLDRHWNIVMWNEPHERFIRALMPTVRNLDGMNALDLVFDPALLRKRIPNWQVVAAAVLRRLRRQLARRPDDEAARALWDRVRRFPGAAELPPSLAPEHSTILIPLQIELDNRTLSWFSTLAAFGAAGDVTLEELVIESFFPANRETREFVERLSVDRQE